MTAPICPDCGQPATTELLGDGERWICRNEACPEFGQPLQDVEPPSATPSPDGGQRTP